MADFSSDDLRQACLDLKTQIQNKLSGATVDWVAVARAVGVLVNFSAEIFGGPVAMQAAPLSIEDCAKHLDTLTTATDHSQGMRAPDMSAIPWKQILSVLLQWLLTRGA